jgi:hypothetical protein
VHVKFVDLHLNTYLAYGTIVAYIAFDHPSLSASAAATCRRNMSELFFEGCSALKA